MIMKGVRELLVRWQICLLMMVRNTAKRKGKSQGETDGEEGRENLERMRKQKKRFVKKIPQKRNQKEKKISVTGCPPSLNNLKP